MEDWIKIVTGNKPFKCSVCGKEFNKIPFILQFDPVAYRVEPLIDCEFTGKPIQVPHYKGRKRLHLGWSELLLFKTLVFYELNDYEKKW